MRYATAAAFRTAFEQRLLAASPPMGVPLALLRKLVAFQRLLTRLLVVAPDRWVPKGALAFHFRLAARFRTTKDSDRGLLSALPGSLQIQRPGTATPALLQES